MRTKTTILKNVLKTLFPTLLFSKEMQRETGHISTSQEWNPTILGKRLPLSYLMFANLLAFVGYYFILFFPILFAICVYNTYVLFPYTTGDESVATFTLLWLTLSLFFGHISYNVFTVNFGAIPGLKIKRKSTGVLYNLLDTIQQHYPAAKIKQIIISGNFELRVVKVPNIGIPLYCRRVLVVGLPLMLTLSPTEFNCLFTREIIQHSKTRVLSTAWLNQLRDVWSHYLTAPNPRSSIGHQLLLWFFGIYSPLYNAVSLPARLADELNTDRNALDLINSDELLGAFQASLRANIYLRKEFWPRIISSDNGHDIPRPFSILSRAVKSVLLLTNSNDWLQQHYLREECALRQQPTLKQRMDNLGVSSVTLPPNLTQTAAEYYLQDHFAKIIVMSDDNWRDMQRMRAKSAHNAGVSSRLLGASGKRPDSLTKNSKAKVV